MSVLTVRGHLDSYPIEEALTSLNDGSNREEEDGVGLEGR